MRQDHCNSDGRRNDEMSLRCQIVSDDTETLTLLCPITSLQGVWGVCNQWTTFFSGVCPWLQYCAAVGVCVCARAPRFASGRMRSSCAICQQCKLGGLPSHSCRPHCSGLCSQNAGQRACSA